MSSVSGPKQTLHSALSLNRLSSEAQDQFPSLWHFIADLRAVTWTTPETAVVLLKGLSVPGGGLEDVPQGPSWIKSTSSLGWPGSGRNSSESSEKSMINDQFIDIFQTESVFLLRSVALKAARQSYDTNTANHWSISNGSLIHSARPQSASAGVFHTWTWSFTETVWTNHFNVKKKKSAVWNLWSLWMKHTPCVFLCLCW